jgi:hypothetical protein
MGQDPTLGGRALVTAAQAAEVFLPVLSGVGVSTVFDVRGRERHVTLPGRVGLDVSDTLQRDHPPPVLRAVVGSDHDDEPSSPSWGRPSPGQESGEIGQCRGDRLVGSTGEGNHPLRVTEESAASAPCRLPTSPTCTTASAPA